MFIRRIAAVAAVAGIALGGAVFASSASATPANVPVCQPVQVANGSATYKGQACNTSADNWIKAAPVGKEWQLAFSGGLANGFSLFAFQQPKTAHVSHTLTTASAGGLSSDPLCWGHNGINAPGLIMAECISQPSGLGGALYWSANEANFNWDKHPGSGLLWVEASTLRPTADSNPVNAYQDFWVGIALPGGAFCSVINPGYDQHPTQCEVNGVIKTMDPRRQASYDQFAAAMVATGVPDCAWSMTVTADEAQCDIDS